MQGSGTAPGVEHGKDKRPNVTVNCMAAYQKSMPTDMGIEDANPLCQEHLDDIPLGDNEYVMDSDELDEDNCDFKNERRI